MFTAQQWITRLVRTVHYKVMESRRSFTSGSPNQLSIRTKRIQNSNYIRHGSTIILIRKVRNLQEVGHSADEGCSDNNCKVQIQCVVIKISTNSNSSYLLFLLLIRLVRQFLCTFIFLGSRSCFWYFTHWKQICEIQKVIKIWKHDKILIESTMSQLYIPSTTLVIH